jgi:hypothetical protein
MDLHLETHDWKRRALRLIVFDFVILFLALSSAELFLRQFAPQTQRLIYTQTISGGHAIEYNRYGLRDVDFTPEKPRGEKWILVLGNSTTFGSGVAMENTYPKQLERILQPPHRVINAGGQGSSLPEALKFLNDTGLSLNPDMIILGFSPSMIAKSKLENTQEQAASTRFKLQILEFHKILGQSYVYAAFNHYVRKNLYRFGLLRDDLTTVKGAVFAYGFDVPGVDLATLQADYDAFISDLENLKNLAESRKIPLIILGIPSLFELGDGPEFNPRNFPRAKIRIQPLDKINAAAKALDIPYIDLREALKTPENLYISGDYAHLNEAGHEATARILAPHINSE